MKMKRKTITALSLAVALGVGATDMKDLKIYVNPGHGGHDSDDRNVVVPPFKQGDADGFWESNSNLDKGLALRDLLEGLGANVMMSRTTNTTDDDRNLHEIGYEANAYGADFMFAIHSNATGTSARNNQPLMLYRGFTNDPVSPEAKAMSLVLNRQLLENQVTSWSSTSTWLAGDYDFYDWGVGVGLGVLRKLTVPGMLSEGSYHDYIPETYRLLNKDYCWLEAYHFTKSVMEYFNTAEKFSTGVVCGALYDSRLVCTDAIYNGIFYGHDESKPVCGATVQLLQGGEVKYDYTTDALFNGVYMMKAVEPGTYTLKVTHSEYDNYEQEVTVTANTVTYQNLALDRTRSTAPEVVSYSPVWNDGDAAVACNEPVVLNFNWDMDTESVEKNFSITPSVEGTIRWEDSQYRLVFEPKRAYDTNTLYTVRLAKDAKHPAGLSMKEDFVMQFRTDNVNVYQVVASSPSEGAKVHYKTPTVEFRFDGQPTTDKIQEQIVVKDKSGNQMGYSVRTKKFSKDGDDYGYFQIRLSNDLTVGETYTVEVSGDVCNKNGIKVAEPMTVHFTAVDASVDPAAVTLVDALDASGALAADVDASTGCSSLAVAANTSTKLEGSASVKVDYQFENQDGGKAVVNFATEPATAFTKDNMIALKVYGDLSGNQLNAVLANGSETKIVTLAKLDFLGWKHADVSLAGIGDGNYTLKGFEVVQTGNFYGKKGTLYLDKVAVGAADDAGVGRVSVAGLRIYPNPASELLIANADCTILGIEVVALDGRKVAQAVGNVINVSELAEGVYVAKIHTTAGTENHKFAVKH